MADLATAVNGAFADQNAVLLTDILRDEWGFSGFVTSDWVWGTHDAVDSLVAGLDIEMPLRMHRARTLPGALRTGRLPRSTVLLSTCGKLPSWWMEIARTSGSS